MINVCDKCGGLYTTANEERYAGTPCQCPNRQPDIGRYIRFDHAAAIPALPTVQPTPTTEVKQRARPKIICLCGSTRFVDTWISEYQRLSDEGNIVLTCARMPPRPNLQYDEPELKQRLDELHKHKIDLADEVFVLNVDGYIGVSTVSEIAHAQARGIPIRYFTSDVKEGGVPRRAEGE